MNTNDLKTFEILPFGATLNSVGFYSTTGGEMQITTLPGKSLLDNNLVKTVQVVDTYTGFPLEKANVYAKSNPKRGGSTDANGEITIVAQSPNETIVFQYQNNKIERVFNSLGSMISIDTTMTQAPVVVDATPGIKADNKVNWLKWLGLGAAGLVLINMASEDKPKKVKV